MSTVFGVDFTSSPSLRKPITVACGTVRGETVRLNYLLTHPTLAEFEQWLTEPGPWVGAFDFPFGLPRELVQHFAWPQVWAELINQYASLSRAQIRDLFKGFTDARPAGGKFAHRACDRPAGSSPSMKWVNPPVAYMLHAGAPALIRSGVTIPGLQLGTDEPNSKRIALEGYPGFLAKAVIKNTSYKSDDKSRQTPERLIARRELLEHLIRGHAASPLRLQLTASLQSAVVQDASGDLLDAVLCMLQAAAATVLPNYGLPLQIDPLEGWICTVPQPHSDER